MLGVSVIMPVYNAEKYLGEAIDSVLNQTYPDFELLLINDRSTDRSKEICLEYQKRDSRIVVLENNSENHGPGPTRNIGLDYATGKYIYFMDADDWAEPELLEQAVKRIEEDHSDMVVFGNITEVYGTDFRIEKSPEFVKEIWTREEIKNNLMEYWKVRSISLWSHLIRRKIIGNFRFENISITEDDCFFLDLLTNITSISYLNQWLYHYRVLWNSTSHKWNKDIVEYIYVKWKHESFFLEKMYPRISQTEYTDFLMMNYLRIIYELAHYRCPLTFGEKWEKIKQAQEQINLEKQRKYIDVRGKKGVEKLKYFLVKNRMDWLLLILGIITLRK